MCETLVNNLYLQLRPNTISNRQSSLQMSMNTNFKYET
jgi:hypothetical protein